VDAATRAKLGMQTRPCLDADCLITQAAPHWMFNRVIGLGLEQVVSEADIDALITLYHDQNVPIGISLCPHTKTSQIPTWLEVRGFAIANTWVKMLRDTTAPKDIPCDLQIKLATTDHEALVAEIITTGFELGDTVKPVFSATLHAPHNRVYIAWDGKNPAAVAILTIDKQTGHLNTTATLPEYRGLGAQGSLMAHRIREGIQAGCRHFVTETWWPGEETNHSYNNMLRHGFELAYQRPNWVLTPPGKT